jgi:hypothetical protein
MHILVAFWHVGHIGQLILSPCNGFLREVGRISRWVDGIQGCWLRFGLWAINFEPRDHHALSIQFQVRVIEYEEERSAPSDRREGRERWRSPPRWGARFRRLGAQGSGLGTSLERTEEVVRSPGNISDQSAQVSS